MGKVVAHAAPDGTAPALRICGKASGPALRFPEGLRSIILRCLLTAADPQRPPVFSAGDRAINLGGSIGNEFFRPANSPHEASGITVKDCLIMNPDAAIAFVGSDQSSFRHNTIIHPQRWVLRILQENTAAEMTPCRRGTFTHNLIVFHSSSLRSAVNAGPGTAPDTFTFARNAWYCEDAPQRSRQLSALPSPETDGRHGIMPTFTDSGTSDFSQPAASPLRAFGIRD